ncbi:SapC family protein [Halomonas sp. McH1-25]|uniref:SapC family protein n=1 Tax=unclassified Halomonas TaxID=2609666 RepID=UPI001EF53ED7|nr:MULTISPECIES: SapC family protein [unclassified Halomonas]MCG7600458.1 SapC family protein [Halomonas sp. McH1-25]MCP1342943.1 SapC family protein [Halomonas sp. FL8]MCP1359965.1 SapC family protein [Halomonas sp. BBD45]MCP1364297.1 SapC family protein [Halomonas sp. BBD48]
MSQWIAVSRTEHVDKYFWPRQGYGFAAQDQVVPVLIAELTKLLPHYALAFIQQGEGYQPVALTGLAGERNLYVHSDGRWLASYVPSVLRGYPFRMANTDNGQQVLAIEQDSLTDEPSAQPLFDEQGKLAEKVQQTLNFLTQCDQNRQVTAAACQALSQAGVIEAWPLTLERGEGQEPVKVQGLYRISEKALNELDAEPFANLRSHGALPLAYAQLLSMSQLSQLSERVKFHAQHHASQPATDSLDELFGEGDGDLTFDFGD